MVVVFCCFFGGSITHTEKMFFFENDMQYYNIYNNMMAYGAMNHCLLFGWRKIWIFHEFYFLFLPQKEELDFCYHDLLFYVNAIA